MLNMNPVVQVNISVGSAFVPNYLFNIGAIITPTAGTGTPLTATSRFAEYGSLDEITTGEATVKPAFASTTDVYKAAAKYFGVSPKPSKLIVIFFETDPEAEEYSSSKTYAVGDYCTHSSKIYMCNTAIQTAEEWTADHWDEVTPTTDTPAIALVDAIEKGAEFYGVYYSPIADGSDGATKTQLSALVSALDALDRGVVFYGVTGTAEAITDASGVLKAMKDAKTKRALGMSCTSAVDDAAGLMGVAMGFGNRSNEADFQLAYKPVATATANNFTQTEVSAIKAMNGNVYVSRTKNHTGLENGATGSGLRYNEVLFMDKIAAEIQEGIFDMIAGSDTKLPQTDSTTTLFIAEINRILEGYYNIGVLAPAEWKGNRYGAIEEGMIVEHGYYVFAESFDTQSDEDRAARKGMPITVLICLSGSVETVVINIDVQT